MTGNATNDTTDDGTDSGITTGDSRNACPACGTGHRLARL